MPLYIPWLTETIKKRGVRYLLHHYLGQFFLEKLTLEQLSIDIYEGKGSIKDLGLDVDGLNDELDFVPFRFLEGCTIGQISVEVPWSSLATEACRVELDEAKFVCRLKTSADATKTHCTESTLLSRSLMTSSMQMAEEIVTTEDDDEYDSPESSIFKPSSATENQSTTQHGSVDISSADSQSNKKKTANQMFEGLEMFAQLIDSVLRRTKLTARNTLFQIQPHKICTSSESDEENTEDESDSEEPESHSGSEEFSEPLAKSEIDSDSSSAGRRSGDDNINDSRETVEFFIKFFRCEEIVDQTSASEDLSGGNSSPGGDNNSIPRVALPTTITKLLTLEDVEMRIDGVPVSNLVGKHTITIKFNGQKSEISIFSGSPLLAVIGHKQLETFFNVFDSAKDNDLDSNCSVSENNQKLMSPEDYANIENQLLESASIGGTLTRHGRRSGSISNNTPRSNISGKNPYYISSPGSGGGRRWVETGQIGVGDYSRSRHNSEYGTSVVDDYSGQLSDSQQLHQDQQKSRVPTTVTPTEPTLDNIEAFSCELKLPGIWLCILRDGEMLPPLIKPYADSINSFQSINKYIDQHIKVPHIRCLALKVALDMTATTGTNIFLGDLDISEHLLDDKTRVSPIIRLLHNDASSSIPMNLARYKALIRSGKTLTIELLTSTRMLLDPTMLDRIVFDYKLINLSSEPSKTFNPDNTEFKAHLANDSTRRRSSNDYNPAPTSSKRRHRRRTSGASTTSRRSNAQRSSVGGPSGNNSLDMSLSIRGEQFKIELLCPIPDLTPTAQLKPTLLRPQSFIFDFKNIDLTWQSDKLTVVANELSAYVKTQPKQSDSKAVRFIESTSKGSDKISLILEPSPSNLDNAFTSDIEQALNESTLYDSIYVSQATESRIPTGPFQTKRRLIRPVGQQTSPLVQNQQTAGGDCDHEKILTPGDRQHLLDYLNQTLASTKLSIQLHLPICEVEFEDKEQLDLIYNRFGNDFVFWQPKAFSDRQHQDHSNYPNHSMDNAHDEKTFSRSKSSRGREKQDRTSLNKDKFKRPNASLSDRDSIASGSNYESEDESDDNSNMSFRSMDHTATHQHPSSSASRRAYSPTPGYDSCYDNELSCKITVDELFVKFNHQSCAAALKQEISADNLLLGIVIDVDKKPNTLLSLVADNLELSNDLTTTVLEGNFFSEKSSIFALTAEIKRPNESLKDIKLAIQLSDALFADFQTETYSRFWQSINVTDEPIMGYEAPQILTELHVDILSTSLMLIKDGARPSLISIDELYLTSMVMQQTSQAMIRLLADEVSLYMKRDRQGLEIMKNYICLIDSGLIDLDLKFGQDGQLEFGVINNVITVRVCQDSLSALFRLVNVLIRSSSGKSKQHPETKVNLDLDLEDAMNKIQIDGETGQGDEVNLLEDAMNDYAEYSSVKSYNETEDDEEEEQSDFSSRKSEASSSSLNSGSSSPERRHQTAEVSEDEEDDRERQGPGGSSNNTCLLDESNPMLGDLFSQPLVPTNLTRADNGENEEEEEEYDNSNNKECNDDDRMSLSSLGDQQPLTAQQRRAMEESDFFVIGDDDVGAGIIDKNQQHEPLVRKLIDGPINIIENYFKMTKPRTLPEMLVNSLQRYVLEEMTMVVNLYGGHDFDDPEDEDEEPLGGNEVGDEGESFSEAAGHGETASSASSAAAASKSLSNLPSRLVAATATSGAGGGSGSGGGFSELDDAVDSSGNHHNSLLAAPIRTSRTGSEASPKGITLASAAKQQHRLGGPGSSGSSGGGGGGGDSSGSSGSLKRRLRRKYLSEGASSGSGARPEGALEQRSVRFGEGAVNLWESLDLMSSPDFLGVARSRPSQPPLSSDSKQAGGTWRQNDVCIQLILNKVKLLFEVADVNNSRLAGASTTSAQGSPSSPASTTVAGSSSDQVPSRLTPTTTTTTSSTTTTSTTTTASRGGGGGGSRHKQIRELNDVSGEARPATTTTTIATAGPLGKATSSSGTNTSPVSWRFMLFVQDIEVKDRIAASDINKMLYEYCTESMPKRSSQFLTIKNIATLNQSDGCEECDLRVSLKPIRLNIDQDALLFLIEFFTTLTKSLARQRSAALYTTAGAKPSSTISTAKATLTSPCNLTTTTPTAKADTASHVKAAAPKNVPNHNHIATSSAAHTSSQGPSHATITHHAASGTSAGQQAIYIKSFTFSPDVPIRIDYHAKHWDFEQGALAGILMGLAHLDHSELVLKRVQAKHGMRGLDRVLLFALNSWLTDIKRNQLPSILGGVGPMHSVIQLFQGLRDLIWMPIDHYRKDGRLVRGLQRGASSFSSSTAMAAINLVNRFISIVQCTAQIAHDIVTPPSLSGQQLVMLGGGGGSGGATGRSGLSSSAGSRSRLRRPVAKTSAASLVAPSVAVAASTTTAASTSTTLATKHNSSTTSGGASVSGAAQSSLSSSSPSSLAGGATTPASMRRFHHNHHQGGRSSLANRLGVGSSHHHHQHQQQQHDRLNQPRNFCEGVAVGFSIIREGFNDTARNVTVGMQGEDMRSAVGGIVRQIPSTLLNPIISATEGAQSVLVGIRNQIAPDARREDQEKWKGRVRGK